MEDSKFRNIAVQLVGDTGYTTLINAKTGEIYFHPQEKLIGKNINLFEKTSPKNYNLMIKSISDGTQCIETEGNYDWVEVNGEITSKYLYNSCSKIPTEDNVLFIVTATTYLDEFSAMTYLDRYNLNEKSSFGERAIKQKAEDVAKQIEIYLKAYPKKTVADLQEDEEFQKIAVQKVGETGYTALVDYDKLITRFHKQSSQVNLDLHTISDKAPDFYNIIK
jgi:hypothetical protein